MGATGYVNGEFCDLSEARISILDRGLLFGDSLYEALRINNGRAFRVLDHYQRMADGLTVLDIPVPFSAGEFGGILQELVRRNGIGSGIVYIQVTRGAAMRSHAPPKGLSPSVLAFIQEGPVPSWGKYPNGVAAITVEDVRWRRCNLKTTMLLGNVLGKRQAVAAGAFEGIFVSQRKIVREGTLSNVFAVIRGTLRTHPADRHILPGVTRKIVLELARKEDMPVAEEPFGRGALLAAEECFLTGTTSDVCPVVRVDERTIGDGRIGPATALLMRLLAQKLEEETA